MTQVLNNPGAEAARRAPEAHICGYLEGYRHGLAAAQCGDCFWPMMIASPLYAYKETLRRVITPPVMEHMPYTQTPYEEFETPEEDGLVQYSEQAGIFWCFGHLFFDKFRANALAFLEAEPRLLDEELAGMRLQGWSNALSDPTRLETLYAMSENGWKSFRLRREWRPGRARVTRYMIPRPDVDGL